MGDKEGKEVPVIKGLMPFFLVLGFFTVLLGAEKVSMSLNFEECTEGRSPEGFKSLKSGKGSEGNWVVVIDETAPSPKKVLAQTSDEEVGYRFPIFIYEDNNFSDGIVKVSFKAVYGKRDRAAGVVFRFQDPANYYVLRANALEDNVDLYKFKNGKRKKIAWADVKVSSQEWHMLKVECKGTAIQCYFNNKLLIRVEDETYKTGKIGLWTKADSVTYFDDLVVEPLE